MQSGIRLGVGGLRNLVNMVGRGGKARQVLNALQQAAEMSGVPAVQQGARRAAVNAGLVDELTAFPSAVSRQGGNVGLLGSRTVPTARQLGQAPVPQFGPGSNTPRVPEGARVTNTLIPQPFQGPRPRGGDIVPTSTNAPLREQVRTEFTEDLISPQLMQGPSRAPMQGPSMTGTPVQGQLDLRFPPGARSTTEFTTAKGAVRPAGTNIAGQPYRGGPVASQSNLEVFNPPAIQGPGRAPLQGAAEAPVTQGSFFIDNAPDVWTDSFRIRPELMRQLPAEVQQRIGTTMLRGAADLGPVAPRPAFGPNAGPAPVDPAATAAFLRNAAAGNELVDLNALLSDPRTRAAIGAAGAGAFGLGVGNMVIEGNRTGQTTAGSPPDVPTQPLFTESDGSPLGAAPGVAPGMGFDGAPVINPPAPGNIDPTVVAPVTTTGGAERYSAVREALAQTDPVAAAVMRATEPMSPEKYTPERGGIARYYADRQAYASQAPVRKELIEAIRGMQTQRSGDLAGWAASNPALAYQYQAQQQQLKNPAANQQSAETITTTTVTAPIGTQVDAAAVGNAQATADAATAPTQGAFDMVDVTRPQVQPNLQRVRDFIQQQAPRSAMYAGY